ncbi:ubiquitinyl hydrolase 1 [Paramarasmius palmivorus]|uniref:Ubiquitin carboxyl-terminal hydrolase n=1 Tax=Paramarasmius palmivorus TaxID=297713 RepID=A0AAW0CP55_9AGAR
MATTTTDSGQPRKKFIPLESNPEVFTDLAHALGVPGLQFQEVYSLENDLLGFISRPVLALVVLFPAIGDKYLEEVEKERNSKPIYNGCGEGEDAIWYKQTIRNACGLYGILHALSNGTARKHIVSGSLLERLLTTCVPLTPDDRALALEASSELEEVHTHAGKAGVTSAPTDPDVEVDFHYTCFVPSHKNGRLYQLDGMNQGPTDTGIVLAEGEDLLSANALSVIQNFIKEGEAKYESIGFNLMALTHM